ncbi:MAG TPA: SAM-dependent DNA methyltransferase [Candidatus Egerieenecus merdigallinarum]|nr:SAM-dependent DNA methyltransferase [Candidatus Egerieenecus merdigallinarum]
MSNLTGFVKRLRDIMRNDAGINGDAQRIEQIAWMLFLKVYDAKELDWAWDDEGYQSIIPEPCRWQHWAHDDRSGKAMTGDKLLDFVNNTLFPVLKGNDIKDTSGNVLIPGVHVDASTPISKAIVQTTFADANQYMKDGVLLRQVINVIDALDLSDYEESHAFGEIYETILKELQSAGSAGEFYTPRAVTDFMAQVIHPQIGETMADFACGTGGFLVSWLKELKKQVTTTDAEEAYSRSIYGIEKKQFPYMLCVTNLLLHGLDVPRVYHANSLLRDVLDYTEADKMDVVLMNPPYGGSEKAEVKNHFPADLASSETADLFMSVIMYRLKQNGRAAVILPDGFLFGTDNAKVNIKRKLLREFNLHTVVRLPGSVFSPYTSITTNILFFDHTHPTEETWFYRLDMPQGYKHFSKTKPMKPEHFQPVLDWWNDRREITQDGFDKAKKFTVHQLTQELGYNLDQCGYPHEEEEILAPLDLIHRYEEQRASLNAEIDRVLAEITNLLGGNAE